MADTPSWLTNSGLSALLGSGGPKAGTKAPPSAQTAHTIARIKPKDSYAQALEKQRAFLDNRYQQWGEDWDRTYQADMDVLSQQLENVSNDFIRQQDAKKSWIAQHKQGDAAVTGKVKTDQEYEALFNASDAGAKFAASQQQMQNVSDAYKTKGRERSATRAAAYQDFINPLEDTYNRAVSTADQLRESQRQQSEADAQYAQAVNNYNNAVTQHDKDQAAYDMYVAKKKVYDQDTANRQADIDAGRYAVNPYQFMAQGANINEIEALRQQVNAGNLRPNMRVPDAEVAPTEVKAPVALPTDKPARTTVEAPQVDDDVAAVLGYQKPEGPKASDATLVAPTTTPTDTSSVHSEYTMVPDKNAPKADDKPKDASGNPVINQPTGAATLQTTASQAATPTTQQTPTQAATPAPAIAPQASGAVGGQGNSTGQDQTAPPQPKSDEKPAPFTPDEKKKDEQDSVF